MRPPRLAMLLAPCALLAACQAEPPPVATPALPPVAGPDRAGPPPTQPPLSLAGRPFFCAPLQPPPGPVPYCTRSLGPVDCWTRPPLAIPLPRGVADGRATLTEAQEARRTRCWPGLF